MSSSASDDLFAEGRYGERSVGFGRGPAILVIDLQKAVTHPESPLGRSPAIHAAVGATARLLAAGRQAGIPIFTCVQAYRADLSDEPRWKVTSADEWIEGTWFTELDERVAHADHVTIIKKAPSIFFGTPLVAFLTALGVDTTVIAGATTSGCVRASVIDSFSYGYRTIIARECVGDQGEQEHRANLRDMERRYADVVGLESLIERFSVPNASRFLAEPARIPA